MPRGLVPWLGAALGLLCCACFEPPTETRNAYVGGRVLMAPGAGLAGAHVVVDQIDRFSKTGAFYRHIGETVTDADGYFDGLPTGIVTGLISFQVSGGAFVDPITGTRIQLDPGAELRALHWLELFEDRGKDIYITPIHSMVAARFRYKLAQLHDPVAAYQEAYAHLNYHFGALDWDRVVPADLTQRAVSPTNEVRAAFLLGGLAVLADDARIASESTPQVVNLMTLTAAAVEDVETPFLDGNDANNLIAGTGLELGACPAPSSACAAQSGDCQLGTCRPSCSLYANTYRTLLSGATSKFIGTRTYPSVWNQTTLGSEDARTMIDNLGRNTDVDLFNDACVETVDRIPPSITWLSPRDGELFVKGEVLASITASDDTGAEPKASFVGLSDEDGDVTNRVARTTLHTRAVADGPVTVTALAVDLNGNQRRSMRTFQIDNTAPDVTIDSSAFVVDARAWWTSTEQITLRGTVTEVNPKSVVVTVGEQSLPVPLTGAAWSIDVPAGSLSSAGTLVTVRAEDLAGNVTTRTQTLRLDTEPPVFSAIPTSVKDERGDVIGFIGVTPTHTHAGPVVTLGAAGCPDVYKYAYLLDQNPPPFGGEIGARNPLLWAFQLADAGVGINPTTAQYRVRRGSDGAVLRDWTQVGGTAVGTSARRYDLPLYRAGTDPIPALGTTEGPIEIDLRGEDLFGHPVTGTRCWTHHPLGSPVFLEAGYTPGVGGHPAHPLSLNAHGLEVSRIQDLSSLLLNDNSTGASTMEAVLSNGTAEAVYLRVDLTAPATAADVTRKFSVVYEPYFSNPEQENCTVQPAFCNTAPGPVSVDETLSTMSTPFEIRLYTASASGTPLGLVPPCSEPGCDNSPLVRTFRLAPRTNTTDVPKYIVSAWLTRAEGLRPSGGGYPLAPPFVEFDQAGHSYTGKQSTIDYCSRIEFLGQPRARYCTERTTYQRRQNVDSATMTLGIKKFIVRALSHPLNTDQTAVSAEATAATYSTQEM